MGLALNQHIVMNEGSELQVGADICSIDQSQTLLNEGSASQVGAEMDGDSSSYIGRVAIAAATAGTPASWDTESQQSFFAPPIVVAASPAHGTATTSIFPGSSYSDGDENY